jgi:hypothetical protein
MLPGHLNPWFLPHFHNGAMGNGFETIAIAGNLAATGQFANPFQICPTSPTAIVPPVYPACLALLIRIFGFSVPFVPVVYAITAAVHGLHAALLPSVSELLFCDRCPGIFLAFSVCDFLPQFETIWAAVAPMHFCLAAQRSSALILGIFAGFLMLLNPAARIAPSQSQLPGRTTFLRRPVAPWQEGTAGGTFGLAWANQRFTPPGPGGSS